MSYLALYRKYRPTTFDKLVGQDGIVKTLVNQIESGRLGHAYLFTGTRGTGKTSSAKIFAKAVNCLHPVNGSPCGECESCKALSDPSNIDVIEIDAASNNGVNEIRDLREKVQYPPVSCKYKVYIIDEVHMLTGAAFNALLKTLEEPPKHAIFILATTEAHKIPATVLSRCMRFDFKLVPTDTIASLICDIYDEQGKKYNKEAVYAIAKAGEGSIRDALSIADIALSFNNSKLTYNDVMEILGSTNDDLLAKFIKSILDGNTGAVLNTIDELSALGKSMGVLNKDVTGMLRDIIVAKICSNPNGILRLPEDKFNTLKEIADGTNSERLLRTLEIFSDSENSLKYTNHPRVVFETSAIKASRPDSDYNFDSLISRIKTLEDKIDGVNFIKTETVNNFTEIKKEEVIKVPSESVSEEKTEEITEENNNKPSVGDNLDSIEGELLTNLRKNGHQMLWTVMQDVKIGASGDVLILTVKNSDDEVLFLRDDNKGYIKEALSGYAPFAINVKVSDSELKENKFDEASDKIKKLFGDDIVIIKD